MLRVALGLEVGVTQPRRLYDLNILLLMIRPLRRESHVCMRGSSVNDHGNAAHFQKEE